MKKTRLIGMILAHVGLALAIAYLIFFLVVTFKVDRTASALNDPEASVSAKDMYLMRNVQKDGFSFLSVGRALSDKDDPGRDVLLLIVDLIVPLLCFASGILLQIISVRKNTKHTAVSARSQYDHTSDTRRQS